MYDICHDMLNLVFSVCLVDLGFWVNVSDPTFAADLLVAKWVHPNLTYAKRKMKVQQLVPFQGHLAEVVIKETVLLMVFVVIQV